MLLPSSIVISPFQSNSTPYHPLIPQVLLVNLLVQVFCTRQPPIFWPSSRFSAEKKQIPAACYFFEISLVVGSDRAMQSKDAYAFPLGISPVLKWHDCTHSHKVFFAFIVVESMTKPKFTEATAEALGMWRINVAQSLRSLDPITRVPLAVSPIPNSAV